MARHPAHLAQRNVVVNANVPSEVGNAQPVQEVLGSFNAYSKSNRNNVRGFVREGLRATEPGQRCAAVGEIR